MHKFYILFSINYHNNPVIGIFTSKKSLLNGAYEYIARDFQRAEDMMDQFGNAGLYYETVNHLDTLLDHKLLNEKPHYILWDKDKSEPKFGKEGK